MAQKKSSRPACLQAIRTSSSFFRDPAAAGGGDVGLEVGAAVPEDDEGGEAVVAGRRLARGYVVEAAMWAPQLKTQCPGIKV